ncbi:MAG: hypothetical protein KJO69_05540 [Gammaproteobacteria bacterium]|nr:hypothetical protein [Gammaproteobacteria bacterium]
MNKITELTSKWRDRDVENPRKPLIGVGCSIGLKAAAAELEAALPKWTRITEDQSTWPENGALIVYTTKGFPHSLVCTFTGGSVGYMTAWRPLCDLDFPPEESK